MHMSQETQQRFHEIEAFEVAKVLRLITPNNVYENMLQILNRNHHSLEMWGDEVKDLIEFNNHRAKFKPTKEEYILYYYHSGAGVNRIKQLTKSSQQTIEETIKTDLDEIQPYTHLFQNFDPTRIKSLQEALNHLNVLHGYRILQPKKRRKPNF